MEYFYEIVEYYDGFPIKAFIHSVEGFKTHWHNVIEILLVLEGEVNIGVGDKEYTLNENDLILINRNQVHNISRTKSDNTLLALQIDPSMFSNYCPEFSKMIFNCKSFIYDLQEQNAFDIIRHYMAKVVWEYNKKKQGYQLIIASQVYLLAAHLVNNFASGIVGEEEKEINDKNLARLQRILIHINENLENKITLKDIAETEHLSYYYLSRLIKENLGMSFQDYLNILRLNKAVRLLLSSNKTITEISYESGFANTKLFNKLFKETFYCSPSEYKKTYDKVSISSENKYYSIDSDTERGRTYLDVDRSAGLKKLFTYLKPSYIQDYEVDNYKRNMKNISVNINDKEKDFEHYWKKLITYTRASEGLRKVWQLQLKEVQKEIKFEYIRFHGIFSDDMMVCNLTYSGNIEYNWTYIDQLFDFFKEVNIKPFIELGFMPSELKKTDETVFWWQGNISQPKDIKQWTNLVKEFIKHCINRYGLEEVETWYFEVWNEPDLENVFWIGGKKEYFEFYKETYLAVKSISNKLKVGGPSINYQAIPQNTWLEDFIVYCNKDDISLDFISIHIYPESYASQKKPENIVWGLYEGTEPEELLSDRTGVKRIYFDRNNTYHTLNSLNGKIERYMNYKPEVHITEWNASAYSRNLIHDTCFVATFIISNILKSIGIVDSLGYWTFTDINEESKAGISAFHGGFGLINNNGLKKPAYYAYYLLSKLGTEIIQQGEEYIITKKDKDVQILAYNYAYFDDLFLNGDTSALTNTERYSVYEWKPDKHIEINIFGLSGNYKITRYQLNRENGSVFDEWVKMGMPENMTQEELEYLGGKGRPNIVVEYLKIKEEYKERLYIPVHGIELITLEKKI